MTDEHNYIKKVKGCLSWKLKTIPGFSITGKAIYFIIVFDTVFDTDYQPFRDMCEMHTSDNFEC